MRLTLNLMSKIHKHSNLRLGYNFLLHRFSVMGIGFAPREFIFQQQRVSVGNEYFRYEEQFVFFADQDLKGNQLTTLGAFYFINLFENQRSTGNLKFLKSYRQYISESRRSFAKNLKTAIKENDLVFIEELRVYYMLMENRYFDLYFLMRV